MFGRNSETDAPFSPTPSESSPTATRKEVNVEGGDVIAFVGEEVTFKGTIRYRGTVRIDGRLEGEIHTDGILVIGEKAVISAKIEAGTIACQGRITGDITAKERVKLMAPAIFEGSVKTPSLSMEEGVQFNGTCQMPNKHRAGKNGDTSIIASLEEKLKVP